jgi:hypothetical protein
MPTSLVPDEQPVRGEYILAYLVLSIGAEVDHFQDIIPGPDNGLSIKRIEQIWREVREKRHA